MRATRVLEFRVIGQNIETSYDADEPVNEARRYLISRFVVDETWSGLRIEALFSTHYLTAEPIVLDGTMTCEVPAVVQEKPASEFFVSLVGYGEDGYRITTKRVGVDMKQAGYTSGLTPRPPTPDVYDEIMRRASESERIANEALEEASRTGEFAEEAKDSATQAEFAAHSAMQSSDSATNSERNAAVFSEVAEQSAEVAQKSANDARILADEANNSAANARNAEANASDAANRAEQVAIANGYAEFYMKNGRTYLVRTENIAETLDFNLNNGRLVVKIGG